MIRYLAQAVAWLAVAVVAFATLSPIQLRPGIGHPDLERFIAFFVIGSAFAIAHPRRITVVGVAVVTGAFALEAAQLLAPGRHAHLHDALVKAAGGLTGLAAAILVEISVRQRALRQPI